jgi:nicotinamide-nucleotide amidase
MAIIFNLIIDGINMTSIEQISALLRTNKLKLATAESCTGGMISAGFTDLSGSSDIFDRGFVTYSNEAKMAMLGVSPATLEAHGAVSEQTAREMCEGALKNSLADVTISVTGIAGPSGGTPDKPVGLVYIGVAKKNTETLIFRHVFAGDRQAVRQQTVEQALEHLMDIIS